MLVPHTSQQSQKRMLGKKIGREPGGYSESLCKKPAAAAAAPTQSP